MKVSLNLVKHFLDIDASDDEIIDRFWQRVAEVEDVEDLGAKYENIAIGVIKEAKDHPDADKLGVYQVDIGNETVQVVAGDKTLQRDDRVGYIAPGQLVPSSVGKSDPFVIERVKLRGLESNGMMGSGQELDLNSDHGKVQKLDTDAKAGTLLSEIYDLDDKIIEIDNKSFTHRPDCFGLLGVAREIAGVFELNFSSPDWYLKPVLEDGSDGSLKVIVHNDIPDECPRYMAAAIHGVKVRPSPLKMQSYLNRLGVKPVNNIVDITNYIMVITGQPLHAFDYEKVSDLSSGNHPAIVVRHPKKNEKLSLLSGRTIEPRNEAALIASDKGAIAVGGVMGGSTTEIDETTTKIVLESASFNLYSIRKTSMTHGLFTEAVTRYIRGQSPDQCEPALFRAVSMIEENSGGKLGSKIADVYPKKQKHPEVRVSKDFAAIRLGEEVSAPEIERRLSSVEMRVSSSGEEVKVKAPFWRRDINISEDLVEEVGRLAGFDNLPTSLPTRDVTPAKVEFIDKLKRAIRRHLASSGANEVLTFNFVSGDLLKNLNLESEDAYHIRNSLSPELEYTRLNILPSLIEHLRPNLKQGYESFALFEVNKAHSKKELNSDKLPIERNIASLAFVAKNSEDAGYYNAKLYLNSLLASLNVGPAEYGQLYGAKDLPQFVKDVKPLFEDGRSALVSVDGAALAVVGDFSAKAIRNFKLPQASAGFELDLNVLNSLERPDSSYKKLSRFPKIAQDATFVVDCGVTNRQVLDVLDKSLNTDEVSATVCLNGVYQADGETKVKNMTYHIIMQAYDKTLTTEESNQLLDSATDKLANKFNAKRI